MADQPQSDVTTSLVPNSHPSSSTGPASGDTPSSVSPSSDLPATGHDASVLIPSDVVSGVDAGAEGVCDRSGVDQSLKQLAPCPSPRPASPMPTPSVLEPSSDSLAVVTDITSADSESVPLPASAAEVSQPGQLQEPRLVDPQPNGLQSVPQPTSKLESPLSHADKDCPAPPPTGSIQSPHSPSLPPLTVLATEPGSTCLSGEAIACSTGPITQALVQVDHPSSAPATTDRSIKTSASSTIDSSVCQKQALSQTSSVVLPALDPLPQSSATPTTSTSQPSSIHENSDRGSTPPPVVSQPIHDPLVSPRPIHSVLPQDHVNQPLNASPHPAHPASTVSSPLSPISKRPSSPAMANDVGPSTGFHSDSSPGRSIHTNGNGHTLPSENGHKRQKLDTQPSIQDPSPASSSLPSNPTQAFSSLPPPTSATAPVASSTMASESQAEWLVPGSAGSNFTREQHRYASSVLKNLKKNRYSAPFLFPVDVVKLKIPDYPTIIKNPMDLNTVETRLGKASQPSYYKSAEQFMADVQLIFTNCYTYNGPPDVAPISRMALDLSLQFDSQIKNLPMAHPSPHLSSRSPSLAKPKGYSFDSSNAAFSLKRKNSSSAAGPSVASTSALSGQKRRSSSPQQSRKKSTKTTAYSTPAGGVYYADVARPATAAGVPGRKNSIVPDSSTPRQPNSAKNKPPVYDEFGPELEISTKTNKRKSTAALAPVMIPNTKEELKFCKDLLREVNKKTHEKFVWPFYEPVDPVRLGIPEYFKFIKKPMDLSTIKSKLDKHEYKTGTAFAADFRLMLSNCFQFNPIGTPVYNLGKQLEALFEQKWLERPPDVIPAPVPAQAHSASGSVAHPTGPTTDVSELERIKAEMAVLQERLDRETARNANTLSGGHAVGSPAVVPVPPGKKQSTSKASAAAKNLTNINTTATGTPTPAPVSARPNKLNGGPKAKTGPRKKSLPASAGGPQSAAGKQNLLHQQQLAERQQAHSQLYQQQQAQAAVVAAAAAAATATNYHVAPVQAQAASEYFEKIDYEQKKELATLIQNAVEPMQSEAINLIRAAHPDLVTPDGEEIELDIDALDDRTLYRLYRLVCSEPEAPPPVAPVPVKKKKPGNPGRKPGTTAANGSSKAGIVKKKAPPRKGIDEDRENERIKGLEQQLHAIENSLAEPTPAGAPPPSATFQPAQIATQAVKPPAMQPPAGPEYAISSSESESESDDESD